MLQGQEAQLLAELSKYILLPSIAFCAGFLAKWFLQERKSRNELINALASPRADALRELWAITTLTPQIASLENDVTIPSNLLKQVNAEILEWYTSEGGALFLSWQATNSVFRLLDALRNGDTRRANLEEAVSSLRTILKRDCGMYSYWEARKPLKRPRPSPWLTASGGDESLQSHGNPKQDDRTT
jgi:hypothetical protein